MYLMQEERDDLKYASDEKIEQESVLKDDVKSLENKLCKMQGELDYALYEVSNIFFTVFETELLGLRESYVISLSDGSVIAKVRI